MVADVVRELPKISRANPLPHRTEMSYQRESATTHQRDVWAYVVSYHTSITTGSPANLKSVIK